MSILGPTQAGFTQFLRDQVQIPANVLPDDSIWITYAYNVSIEVTYRPLACVSPTMYLLAVYNLGADNLINYTPDDPALASPNDTYFARLRKMFSINTFKAGVIQSTYDEGTGETMVVPDFYKEMQLSNMENLLTPYGRAYLGIVQRLGTLWGLS